MRTFTLMVAVMAAILMFGRTANGQVFQRGPCPGGVCPAVAPMPKAGGPSRAEPPAMATSTRIVLVEPRALVLRWRLREHPVKKARETAAAVVGVPLRLVVRVLHRY